MKANRATQAKRSRERAKVEKQQMKREDRALRKEMKRSDLEKDGMTQGEDPDLAGIVAGPQPNQLV